MQPVAEYVGNTAWRIHAISYLDDRPNRARNLHWKNKCLIVSSWWQKMHCELPCQFLLIRLSLIRITPLRRYHAKIFVFNGIFKRQIILLLSTGTSSWSKALYIESSVNWPFFCRFHRNTSAPGDNWIVDRRCNNVFHDSSLVPINLFWMSHWVGRFPWLWL